MAQQRHQDTGEPFLTVLSAAIGIGLFLYHTFATRWFGAADALPLLVFILAALCLAPRRYLALSVRVASALNPLNSAST